MFRTSILLLDSGRQNHGTYSEQWGVGKWFFGVDGGQDFDRVKCAVTVIADLRRRLDQQSGQSASDPLRALGVSAKIARDFMAFEERDGVVLSNLFAFAVGVIAIWLNMAIVKAVLGIWMSDERATLAAFAFSAGVLVGGVLVGVRAPPAYDDTVIGPCAGVVVAFAGLWWVHFGRARRRLHMAEQAALATTA